MSTKASVEKHTLPINQGVERGGGLSSSLTLAAVLHGHGGQFSTEEANKTAQWCLGGAKCCQGAGRRRSPGDVLGPLELGDTRYWIPAGGGEVCSHLGSLQPG